MSIKEDWLFRDIKPGDSVIINDRLQVVCQVTNCQFDVGRHRYRKRDGRGIGSAFAGWAHVATGHHLKLVEHYEKSPDCRQESCDVCRKLADDEFAEFTNGEQAL